MKLDESLVAWLAESVRKWIEAGRPKGDGR